MYQYRWFWFSLLIISCSCSHKNYPSISPSVAPLSPVGELLASYVWKESSVVAYKLKGPDTLTYNITKQFGPTDRDDLTLFREDGTFLFEEGQTKYTPQSAQKYYSGFWQIHPNQSELTLRMGQSSDTYQIIKLDTSQMVLKLFVTTGENTYFYLLTYSAAAKSAYGQQKELLPKDTIYTQVDQQPQYPGGYKKLVSFLHKKQQYPQAARRNGIEGKVVIQFVVSPEGLPGQFIVIERLGYGCDEAVLQTCQQMGRWQPGKIAGKPVAVQVTLPVVFKL